MGAFIDFRTRRSDFDGAVEKLVQMHKEDGEWVTYEEVAKELNEAIETIIDELLEEPLDFFTRVFATIATHYDPHKRKLAFDTQKEAYDILPDAQLYFGIPMTVVQSGVKDRWFIEPKDE